MNKVYVVLAGCMDDLSIEGVFSSEEKAKEYISEMMKNAYQASTKPYFEEWDVQ